MYDYRFRIRNNFISLSLSRATRRTSRARSTAYILPFRKELQCMCLLAGHAGRGWFSVVLIDSRASGSERKVQALPAHNLSDRARARLSRIHTARLQATSKCFHPRFHVPQKLTRTASCSRLAAKCTRKSGICQVATVRKPHDDAKHILYGYPLTSPLTALACLGAILQILTAQPSSAEASLQVNIATPADFACTPPSEVLLYMTSG